MELNLRPMTEAERLYCYSQSQQIMAQTGCIGHLWANMDTDGRGFFSSWDDHMEASCAMVEPAGAVIEHNQESREKDRSDAR